jgi:hypothetical protein
VVAASGWCLAAEGAQAGCYVPSPCEQGVLESGLRRMLSFYCVHIGLPATAMRVRV